MTDVNNLLLNNLMDSFDRLHDKESAVSDIHALLFATSKTITDSKLAADIEQLSTELSAILGNSLSSDQKRVAALSAIRPLREQIAKLI